MRPLRFAITALSAGIVATATAPQHARAQVAGRPGSTALDFHARTLGPHPVTKSLADYRGKVVLLAVWATWCFNCPDELASLQRVYAAYASQGLRIAAVSIDRGSSDERILEFTQKLGITYDVLRDADNEILNAYLLRGPPSVIVIDRSGIIRRRNIAAVDWDVDPRLAQIKQLLAEPEPAH
ncbi:MAG: TlpA family protein disulfide reductase [Gemmatimonadota bacterium]|nr:TlpA family protein disulfide reductase [Gemmatimonadota bacterium]